MQHTRMILPGMILALTAVTTEAAFARVATDSLYTKAQNYSAALRFLRVDKGYDVVERDAEAAYLIFRYPTPERNEQSVTGTIEVVELDSRVTLIVKLPQMPQYHERVLSDQLIRKLREEYGTPPPRKPKSSKKKAKRGDSNKQPSHFEDAPPEDDSPSDDGKSSDSAEKK